MEEFKRLFEESIDYLQKFYLGLLYFGEESFTEGEFALWEDDSTQSFSLNINKEEKDSILDYIEKKGFHVTEDWSEFSQFCEIVNDDSSIGLIARKMDNGKAPFHILVDMISKAPRFYFKNNEEAINHESFFYNFADELQFVKSKKTKLRYLRRWLRKKKFISVQMGKEKVFLMIKKGSNGVVVPKDVELFFSLY